MPQQIGRITVDGAQVGTITIALGDDAAVDTFMPDLDGYIPQGRASESPQGGPSSHPTEHHPGGGAEHHHDVVPDHHDAAPAPAPAARHEHATGPAQHGGVPLPRSAPMRPAPEERAPTDLGRPVSRGSATTEEAITEAAKASGLNRNYLAAIGSIESSSDPSSNANRKTQYKGLFQIGREEWRRFGTGNIYNAHDNAMAAGRLFNANAAAFRKHFHRDPSEAEMYMLHQQGLGFYTNHAMTNVSGNRYPGMRGPQTHASFEAGWGREIARRKARFAKLHPEPEAATIDPSTEPM